MLFFHFEAKEVSFLACSPNFKNSTTSEAKIYSAAQITSNNHNSGSISKGTLVNYSVPWSLASAHVRRRWTQKEQVNIQSLNDWMNFGKKQDRTLIQGLLIDQRLCHLMQNQSTRAQMYEKELVSGPLMLKNTDDAWQTTDKRLETSQVRN